MQISQGGVSWGSRQEKVDVNADFPGRDRFILMDYQSIRIDRVGRVDCGSNFLSWWGRTGW